MNLNKNKESIWEGLEENREIVVSKIKEKKETNDFPTLHFEFFREMLLFYSFPSASIKNNSLKPK